MTTIKGSTSSSYSTEIYNYPVKVSRLIITNTSGSDASISIYILSGSTIVSLAEKEKTLAAKKAIEYDNNFPFMLSPSDRLYIVTTGDINYYMVIEPYQ